MRWRRPPDPDQGDRQDYRGAGRDHSDDQSRCRHALPDAGRQLRCLEGGWGLNMATNALSRLRRTSRCGIPLVKSPIETPSIMTDMMNKSIGKQSDQATKPTAKHV